MPGAFSRGQRITGGRDLPAGDPSFAGEGMLRGDGHQEFLAGDLTALQGLAVQEWPYE